MIRSNAVGIALANQGGSKHLMGIFTDNPVLEREVRGRLRMKRKNGVRANVWIAGLLGIVVFYYYTRGLLGILGGTPQDARELWPLLTYGALTLAVLLSPALAATAITQEREQQTWEVLATTQLSAWEVLLGKWIGRQMIPWLLLLILLPYMLVDAAQAGFSWLMLPVVLGFLLTTIACYSALGLLCSFQARRTMTATAAALTLAAFLCVGTVVTNFVISQFMLQGSNVQTPALWLNPFTAVSSLMLQLSPPPINSDNTDLFAPFAYFTITALATAGALTFMVRRYHRSVRERR